MLKPRDALATVATAATMALAALAAHGQTAPEGSATQVLDSTRGGLSEADREFIENAAQAGLAEVEAGRLALERATTTEVKAFAQRMVDEHTKANTKLRDLVRAKGARLPDEPAIALAAKLQLLRIADGADFDRRYADDFGVEAHRDTIELFDREVAQGKDPQLMAFARDTLPALKQHLEMAQALQRDVQSAAAASRGADAPLRTEELHQAQRQIDDAAQVVQRMKGDTGMAALLKRAKGVFILPTYGRGALGVGAQGGAGVLVTRQGDGFSNPVFYNLGGVSLGAQAGGAGGQVAMLLMSDRAVQSFRSGQKFSLTADAGLTFADHSQRAQAATGKIEDVVLWSGTKGAFAGVSVGVTDVMLDDDANRAYYGRAGLTPAQILGGSVPSPRANKLDSMLQS